jgi:hypothetical protein
LSFSIYEESNIWKSKAIPKKMALCRSAAKTARFARRQPESVFWYGARKEAPCLPPWVNPQRKNSRQAKICCTSRMTQQCTSMLAMAQLFFRQQTKRHDDQTTTGIRSQRRINAEEKPVCYGYEENAQPTRN